MGTQIETLQERLNSFLSQLQAECAVFERIVYKNKNQHRRCSYFQYLLKVRRDLRLLQSAQLEEILGSCFQVITGNKPKQKIHLLESLKWRKNDCGTPNFMERLLGTARLLSQMIEPMLKAATELSTLLARSFFMGFSLTTLALLARIRVLVQQVLVDVVTVFNVVSSISQTKQSVKITREGIEVFREYYPTNKETVHLECVWKTDKFVLLERTHKREAKCLDADLETSSVGASAVQYQSIESFLGDDSGIENAIEDSSAKKDFALTGTDEQDLSAEPSNDDEQGQNVEDGVNEGDNQVIAETPEQKLPSEGYPGGKSSLSPCSKPLASESSGKQVAFVSVKRPASAMAASIVSVKKPVTSTANVTNIQPKKTKEDSFFSLLSELNPKDGLL